MYSRKAINARRRKNKLATGMWDSDDGRTLDQSIEIELAALWRHNVSAGSDPVSAVAGC